PGEAPRQGGAGRADRVERRLLQPGRRPVPPLVRARDPRRRDGVLDAVHARRAEEDRRRLPADGERPAPRRALRADHGRGAARRRRGDDGARARDRDVGLTAGVTAAVFLVNPASAAGSTRRRWPELARRAAALGLTGDTFFSERPGHLRELAEQAVCGGAELVVAVGGDGTVNEVAGALAGTDVELAVIPRGTGIDFVRTYAIPPKLEDAVRVATGGAVRAIDVGRVR